MFDKESGIHSEINKRMNTVLKVITAVNDFHQNDGLPNKSRMVGCIYKSTAAAVLLYGSKTSKSGVLVRCISERCLLKDTFRICQKCHFTIV